MKNNPSEILPPIWEFAPSMSGVGRMEIRARAEALDVFLGVLQKRITGVRAGLGASLGEIVPEWISCMARNKDGFTKEEAKNIFYRFRQKKSEAPEEEEPGSEEPQDTDARFNKIMVYMEETSKKLDRIEDDISFLKEQVSDILKRL
ncbi:MAG: hypothetical protein ABIH23_11800 [bacterium]